jgi:hypothetical protein
MWNILDERSVYLSKKKLSGCQSSEVLFRDDFIRYIEEVIEKYLLNSIKIVCGIVFCATLQ